MIAQSFRRSLSDDQLQAPSFASKHCFGSVSDLMAAALRKREFEIDQIVQGTL